MCNTEGESPQILALKDSQMMYAEPGHRKQSRKDEYNRRIMSA